MCSLFRCAGQPFGGKNMVVAGDFAQLPPVGGPSRSLYSNKIGHSLNGLALDGQQKVMGKVVWHQFTTVVILRQNMRQRGMSAGDIAYRTMLENLRYRACTEDDIRLLDRLQLGNPHCTATLNDEGFQNQSVICIWNAHRDSINTRSTVDYARTHNQHLMTFYSDDSFASAKSSSSVTQEIREERQVLDPVRKTNDLEEALQLKLWDMPPGLTDHIAGKLTLCVGMPVMLKINEATELCATNGAEATVWGWKAKKLSGGHDALDVLFVKLVNPPRVVTIKGLPDNVLPLTAQSEKITVQIGDNTSIRISRKQIRVLPNFAMTDYASQGRTRPFNPVNLSHCRTHQSAYTALSRSSTATGTLIVSPIPYDVLRGGADGDIR
ncbi:hypothetical protein BXZ70DRAFT_869367, partial [Cristinia sonorae]